jgi:O-antigen ligase
MSPLQTKVAKYLSWAVAFVLILLPFHAFFTTWIGSNTGHLDLLRIWKEILLALIIPPAIWLAWQQAKLRHWLKHSWIIRLFGLYVLLHLILGALAFDNHQVNKVALIYSLIINLRFIAFFIVCYIIAASSSFLKQNWRAIVFIPAGVVVFFGLIQRFLFPYDFLKHFGYGPGTIPAYQTVDNNIDYRRIQSTLRGANPLGAYLVLIIPATVIALKSRTAKFASLALILTVLFYSYSRSAWIGAFIALAVLFCITKAYAGRLHWVVAFSIATIIICAGAFLALKHNQATQDTLFHTTSSSTATSANDIRSNALRTGLNDIIVQPLGRGPGTAGPASFRTDHTARISENYYLQIGQEVGILGLLIFAVINIFVGLELWRRRRDLLAQVLLASLAGITFINMLSHAWTDDTLAYLWWGLAGIALAPIITEKQKTHGKKSKAKS